ncbi:30681_t:CDS:2, partial [Gigaspora margarita]
LRPWYLSEFSFRLHRWCLGGTVMASARCLACITQMIITTIQKKITNDKLKSPELISTAINLSYLKKAAPKHEGLRRDKYNKACEYLLKLIGDENAKKELLDWPIIMLIKDKKRNAVATLQNSKLVYKQKIIINEPKISLQHQEKCDDAESNQKDNRSFEVSDTI